MKYWGKTHHVVLLILYTLQRLLNTAQGSLLDDEQLVNTLQSSKTTSMEVTEQLEISEQTEVKIDTAREVQIINQRMFVIKNRKVVLHYQWQF